MSEFVRPSEIQTNNPPQQRLLFIDNLRWLMIVLVVLLHLACTYGNMGMWYYQESAACDVFSRIIFSMFGSFTQAFFMGFLFFIAGFFVPSSCDKKGVGRFILDRLVRLGIPTIFYMANIHPFTAVMVPAIKQYITGDGLLAYKKYLFSIHFINGTGPLWFALALLIFSVVYALLRLVFGKFKPLGTCEKQGITHTRVITVILIIFVATFLVRLVQPIGTVFFNLQLCYFAQYIVLFSLGIIAGRCNLLSNLPAQLGLFWFRLALYWGTSLWGLLMLFGGALTDWNSFTGGLHWQAVAYALWESFFCVGICLGLLVIYRERYNAQGKLSRFLSDNAFGVYVFHTPLLVWGTVLVRNITLFPLIKMVLMSIIMLPLCFGFSYLIRKVPLIKRFFS